MAVEATRRLWSHQPKQAGLEGRDGRRDSCELRQIHLDMRRLDFCQSAHANTADNHAIQVLPSERQERLAEPIEIIVIAM